MTLLPPNLRALARALGGEVAGGQVIAPGPCHSRADRSLSVKLSSRDQDGFVVHSFSGDDWRTCRDHVCLKLGIKPEKPTFEAKRRRNDVYRTPRPQANTRHDETNKRCEARDALIDPPDPRIAGAMQMWNEAVDPRGTIVETYLKRRGLHLDDDLANRVLRWRANDLTMLALFSNIHTGEPQAVQQTFLDADGRAIKDNGRTKRRSNGPVRGAAIMIDPSEDVLAGLTVGEGLESCLTARQFGLRPAWALGSAGAIASFPPLPAIECLTLLAEHDDASARAVKQCAAVWAACGSEVLIVTPNGGAKDLNDLVRGATT